MKKNKILAIIGVLTMAVGLIVPIVKLEKQVSELGQNQKALELHVDYLEKENMDKDEIIEKTLKEVDKLEKDLKSTKEELVKKQKTLLKEKEENKIKVSRGVVGQKGRTIKIKLTGYCPCPICCGEWAYKNPGITASGTRAKFGTIAAPKSIPFGTKMKIQGYGNQVFTAEDTGSAVVYKNGVYVIDMWMPTHSQALNVGNRIVEATIIN